MTLYIYKKMWDLALTLFDMPTNMLANSYIPCLNRWDHSNQVKGLLLTWILALQAAAAPHHHLKVRRRLTTFGIMAPLFQSLQHRTTMSTPLRFHRLPCRPMQVAHSQHHHHHLHLRINRVFVMTLYCKVQYTQHSSYALTYVLGWSLYTHTHTLHSSTLSSSKRNFPAYLLEQE